MPRLTILIPEQPTARTVEHKGRGVHRAGNSWRRRNIVAAMLGLCVAACAIAAFTDALFVARHIGAVGLSPSADTNRLRSELAPSSSRACTLVDVVDSTGASPHSASKALVLVHEDTTGHHVWRLWIPPTLLVSVPGHGLTAIGQVRRAGGEAATVQSVKQLTGLAVSQVVELGTGSLSAAVNRLGGVWVDVPEGLIRPSADTSATVQSITPGRQMLRGPQALTFAFAVNRDDTVYAPVRDQLRALLAAASSRGRSPIWMIGLAESIAPYARTTMSIGAFLGAIGRAGDARSGGAYDAVAPGAGTAARLRPDVRTIARLTANMRSEQPFSVPGASPEQAAATAERAAADIPPSSITVTVQNGAGLSGAAAQAASLLQAPGFKITSVGNANMSIYPHTLAIYKKNASLASTVAKYLQPNVQLVPARGLYLFKSDVLLVIGKDWNIARAPVVPIERR